MRAVTFISALTLCVLGAGLAFAENNLPALLPQQFAGWNVSGSLKTSADPAVADPVNAALLKEYGFSDFQAGTYTREDGRKLVIKAARFGDASGAYGAFTYYKMPQMLTESIPDQGSSLNERVLFYRGNILVDALFEKLSAMSAAELRELSQTLPLPVGNTRNLPSLPKYLPKLGYVKNSAKYVVGPVGLERVGAPVSADLVNFNESAEVALGSYQTSGGAVTLVLIGYPTPQLAAQQLRQIDATLNPAPGNSAAAPAPSLVSDKRTGPIVALVLGGASPREARSLLSEVNYDADVTWSENTYQGKKNNLANLLLNVFLLCGILIVFAAVAGLAFGGIRIFLNRFLPARVLRRAAGEDFIALNLSEERAPDTQSKLSSSIKAL